jgi:hypothetical protein
MWNKYDTNTRFASNEDKFIMSICIALLQYSSHVENESILNACVCWEDTE